MKIDMNVNNRKTHFFFLWRMNVWGNWRSHKVNFLFNYFEIWYYRFWYQCFEVWHQRSPKVIEGHFLIFFETTIIFCHQLWYCFWEILLKIKLSTKKIFLKERIQSQNLDRQKWFLTFFHLHKLPLIKS